MVIYEVNIKVDQQKASEYAAWLPGHIQRVLMCEGFEKATWWQVEETTNVGSSFCVQYQVSSREVLEAYFVNHAPQLREEAPKLFGNHFTAARRILLEPKSYP